MQAKQINVSQSALKYLSISGERNVHQILVTCLWETCSQNVMSTINGFLTLHELLTVYVKHKLKQKMSVDNQ